MNGDTPISENLKVINSFAASEPEIFGGLQDFIEKNGKPCCLNLITEKDNKFLKNLAKQQQAPTNVEGEGEEESKEGHHNDEDDELALIMKIEEEENKRKAEEEKDLKAKEQEDLEKRRAKEVQDMAKAELIKQQERDLLDTRSQPIRQYLMDNLVPFLT